ncbi:MAG: TonB-dependent receptor [Acidobacteriia bacterium]|nr:TonB-dependent receptor [Terriglobia bacterium]
MRVRGSLLVVLAVLILFAGVHAASAQVSGSAQLNGIVRDESGGSVAKASITLREVDTNRTYTTVSIDNGTYLVPNVAPGRYEMTVDATGFSKSTHTGIVLSVGQVATIDIDLKVATVGQKVEVTTEIPPVEPSRTEVSQVIDSKQIGSLPISGRLFTDFALLTPGVTTGRTSLQSTITEAEVTRISFGGMRDLSNMVTVDGADTINSATGSQRATPSQEAVSEFRVVNNGFGAEQGRAMGGIVNIITKSGTNDLHGSLYDYLENDAVNARAMLQPSPLPNTLRQNQFGGTLGGPLRKDKTFFFMNYEGQRRAEAPVQSPVLMANLALINAAKAELFGGAPGQFDEHTGNLKTQDTDKGFIKLDHEINKDHRLALRYSIEDGRSLNVLMGDTLDGGGIGAPSSAHNNFLRDQSLVGIVTSQFSPTLMNSALVQYARRHSTFPGVTGQPNLDLPNSLLMGHNFGVFDATYESRFQIADSVSWVKGSHLAKFGVDYNHVNDHIIWPGFSPMRIVLPSINCLVIFANYVSGGSLALSPNPGDTCPLPPAMNGVPVAFWPSPLGTADNSVVDGTAATAPPFPLPLNWDNAYLPNETPNYFSDMTHGYLGLFAQDQWRVTPKFTLNYGMRWDFEPGISDVVNHYYKAFQPRVGLAYSPDRHTVIRAGFGLFFDRYNKSFFFVTRPQRPTTFVCVVSTPNCTGADYALPGIRQGGYNATYALNQMAFVPGVGWDPAATAKDLLVNGTYLPVQLVTDVTKPEFSTVGDGTVETKSKMPYSEQGSLEIDREIGKGLVVNVGYLFVSAHHQVRAENLNVCPVSTTAGVTPAATTGWYECGSNAFENYAAPPPDFPGGKSYFQSVLMPVGLLYYTDNSGNSVYHGVTFSATEKVGQYFRLNANYTFSKTLDDGTFTTFVSTPEDLYRRNLERANSNQDVRHRFVANFVAATPKTKETNIAWRDFEFSGIITVQGARPFTMFVGFDANNDTNPVTDRAGLSARNAYWGDPLRTVDLRVSRSFKFGERQKIELAVDAFNAFNRPNVNEVTSVYGTYDFCNGQVPVNYKDATSLQIQSDPGSFFGSCPLFGPPVPNPSFGSARTMFNPRQLQISLKYSF